MTYTEKHLDQIDARLSQGGRNGDIPRLSRDITDDAELKEAAKDVEMLWQATRLERLQGKLEMLKEYEAKAKAEVYLPVGTAEEGKKAKVISMGKVRLILSVAAGVLLMVVGWYMFRDRGTQEIQNAYLALHFEEYLLHDVARSAEPSVYSQDQMRAFNLYQVGEFEDAIPLLRELWEQNLDTLAAFYLGVSYVAIGEEGKAEEYFDIARPESRYNDLIQRLENKQD